MFKEYLSDLDELILRCKDEKARSYVTEAVACYRAGAFRACIVHAWIAIVFDFIYKLHILDLSGNKQAHQKLQSLQAFQKSGDINATLEFERKVLESAKDEFELLSLMEYQDLKRLQEDRNRCAHPSMQSLDEPYQPSGELARYHLRNAVIHFLQRPPVQGKAAIDHIWNDVANEYFPSTIFNAIEYFKHGPLARANEPLVRGLVIGLTKDLLLQNRTQHERTRQFTALQAISHMYSSQTNKYLFNELPNILPRLSAEYLPHLITYIRHIPLAWEAIGEPGRIILRTFAKDAPLDLLSSVMNDALTISDLQSSIVERIPELSNDALAEALQKEPRKEFIETAITRFGKTKSFSEGNQLAKALIIPIIPLISTNDTRRIIAEFLENDQLYLSSGTMDVVYELLIARPDCIEACKDFWLRVYEELPTSKRKNGQSFFHSSGTTTHYKGHPLLNAIEDLFPEVKAETSL